MQQTDLRAEILLLTRIIEADQMALQLPAVTEIDKERLLLAIEQRVARLADLKEQFAALPPAN